MLRSFTGTINVPGGGQLESGFIKVTPVGTMPTSGGGALAPVPKIYGVAAGAIASGSTIDGGAEYTVEVFDGNLRAVYPDFHATVADIADALTWGDLYASANTYIAPGLSVTDLINQRIAENGAMKIVGGWNASTNSPALASSVGTKGYVYYVTTAGATNLNGITEWAVGDWAVFDGTVWRKNGIGGATAGDMLKSTYDSNNNGIVDRAAAADSATAGSALRTELDGKSNTGHIHAIADVTDLTTQLGGKIPFSQKGAANGVAELDGTGKVPTAQLPAAVLGAVSYQGTWNANTNSPALASGVGTKGFYYRVATTGATNIDGITDWKINDWVIFNGTVWEKVDNTDQVTATDLTDEQNARILADANIQAGIDELIAREANTYYLEEVKVDRSLATGAALQWITDRVKLADDGSTLAQPRWVKIKIPLIENDASDLATLQETSSPNGGVTPGANCYWMLPAIGPLSTKRVGGVILEPYSEMEMMLHYSVVSANNTSVPPAAAVIKTTQSTGTAFMGISRAIDGYANQFFSNVVVINRGVTFRVPNGAPINACDLSHAFAVRGKWWGDVGVSSRDIIAPPARGATGTYFLKTPKQFNGAQMLVEMIGAQGYTYAFDVNEHLCVINAFANYCRAMAKLNGTSHAAQIIHALEQHCEYAYEEPNGADTYPCNLDVKYHDFECYDTAYSWPQTWMTRKGFLAPPGDGSTSKGWVGECRFYAHDVWLTATYPFLGTAVQPTVKFLRVDKAALLHKDSTVISGAISATADASQVDGSVWSQPGSATTDSFSIARWFPPGTHTVYVTGKSGTDGGILKLTGAKESMDFYNGTAENNITGAFTITQVTAGIKTLTFTIATKNASSSGYKARISRFQFGYYAAANVGGGGAVEADFSPASVMSELVATVATIDLSANKPKYNAWVPFTGNGTVKLGADIAPGKSGVISAIGKLTAGGSAVTIGWTNPTDTSFKVRWRTTLASGVITYSDTAPTMANMDHDDVRHFVWDCIGGDNFDYVIVEYIDAGNIAGSTDNVPDPGAAYITDGFGGANATMNGRTPDTLDNGNNWNTTLFPNSTWSVTGSGKAQLEVNVNAFVGITLDDANDDVEADLVCFSGFIGGVVANHNGGTVWNGTTMWKAEVDQAAGTVKLYEYNASAFVQRGSTYNHSGGIGVNSTHSVRLNPDNDTITVDFDGTEVISYNVASRPGKTDVIGGLYSNQGAAFEEFNAYPA